jgi:hypothetical protein
MAKVLPSPDAALVYAVIKIVGYSAFAYGLNKLAAKKANPVLFGMGKTFIGFVGGLGYFYLMVHFPVPGRDSDLESYIGTIPIRFIAWIAALALFYGFREQRRLMWSAVLVGVLYSFALDGIMYMLYHVLPGMQMTFC